MKKSLFRLAAIVAAFMMFSSCSVLKSLTANALSAGTNTGSALLNLYRLVKASKSQSTNSIDLTNTSNLINLGQVIRGAKTVSSASTSFLESFTSGLIKGSANKINNSNVANVISGLKTLNGLDTSSLKNAALKAAMTGAVSAVSNNAPGVTETLSQVNSILGLLK